MQEETFRLPSETAKVTIGEARSNTFVLHGGAVPNTHRFFTKEDDGYELSLVRGMTGRINVQGTDESVEDLAGIGVSGGRRRRRGGEEAGDDGDGANPGSA